MKLPKKRIVLAGSIALSLGTLGLALNSLALFNTFNGTGTSWNVGTDWSLGSIPQGATVVVFNSSSLQSGSTSTLDNSYSFQTLSIATGPTPVSIDANASGTTGRTLTLTGNGGTLVVATGIVNIGVANGVGITTVAAAADGAINLGIASALKFGSNSVISGAFNLSETGSGTLVLAGSNTFGGSGNSFALSGGTLNINNSQALGNAANTFVINGGTIDNTSGAAITTSNYAQTWSGDFTFGGTNALNLGTGAVTLTSSRTLTVNGPSALTVAGAITGNGFGLAKAGNGTLILTGANTYTGPTTVSAGTLNLDFSATGAPATNIINSVSNSSSLIMAGGTLLLTGSDTAANTQRFNGITLKAGSSSTIDLVSNANRHDLSLALGSITRNLGATIDFTLPSGTPSATNGITTSSGSATAVLDSGAAYATVSGNDWAAKDATNSFIVGLSTIPGGYTASTATLLFGNADVASGVDTNLATNLTINTLRFNQNQARSIALGSHTLVTGGILVTSAVGNMSSTISGGTLEGPAFQDLVIYQNNVANGLTITSAIIDNGTSQSALTKAGPGTLTLAGASTYTLGTFLNGGQINLNTPNAIGTGPLTFLGGNIDNTSGGAVTLAQNNTVNWNHDFTFVGSNDLNLGTGLITLNGSLTATVNAGNLTVGGKISGAAFTLTKAGSGTLSLNSQQSGSLGGLNVNGGTVVVSGIGSGTGVLGQSTAIVVNSGGTLSVASDNALMGTTGASPITVDAGGTLAETNNATVRLGDGLFLPGGTLASVPVPGGSALTSGTFSLIYVVAGGTSATSTISAIDAALTGTSGTQFVVNPGASNGIDLDVPGTFFHGSASLDTGLTKEGTGVMRLDGANTYTGPTKITQGTLALAGSATVASPLISVSSGAVFDVTALSSGGFTLASGQNLSGGRTSGTGVDVAGNLATGAGSFDVAGTGVAGTLTINGNLTLNGGSVNLDLNTTTGVGSGVNDLVVDMGNLNLSAPTSLAINGFKGSLATGSYTLITYSGNLTGGASNLSTTINGVAAGTTRSSYVLGTTGASNGALTLAVTSQAAASLTWVGDGTSNVWDLKSTPNFKNGSSPDIFYNQDSVTFNDSGSGTPTISLSSTLLPTAVTVNNTATPYTFGGTGSISGTATLTKSGTGTLTLATANTYTGTTTLNAGQLNLNNASAVGTGMFVIAGGAIDNTSGAAIALTTNNPQKWTGNFTFGGTNDLNLSTGGVTLNNLSGAETVTVNGGGTLSIGGVISGSDNLTKAGGGNLTLSGLNTFSVGSISTTTVSGGVLTLGPAGQTGILKGTLFINSGTTVNANSNWALGFGAATDVSNIPITGGTLNFFGTPGSGGTCASTISLTGGNISGNSFDLGNDLNTFTPTITVNSSTASSVISSGFNLRLLSSGQATFNISHGTAPSGVDLLISGAITTDSNSGINVTGAGVLKLSAANTYTGPTNVNTGNLVVSGSIAGSLTAVNGSSTVQVASGGLVASTAVTLNSTNNKGPTLEVDSGGLVSSPVTVSGGSVTGNGAITGGLTVSSGAAIGKVAPGVNGPGSLTVANNFTLNSGTSLSLDLNGIVAGTQYDQLICSSGTVTLGGSLQLTLGYTPTVGDVFYIILNSGGSAINGTFSNTLDEGNGTALVALPGGQEFLLSYTANAGIGGIAGFAPGQGHDVALLALGAPEPSAVFCLLTGCATLAGLQRIRRPGSANISREMADSH